ncbi:MAG: hypothetical protein ABIP06_05805 [Pyrinomonadaceae bacterium]
MKRRKILPMTKDKLKSWSKKRLLARLKCLHQCEESIIKSDRDIYNCEASDFIEFKESENWIKEYNNLKELLAEREHIQNK